MDEDRSRQLVAVIAKAITDPEKDALSRWAVQLLDIRAGALTPMQKVKQALIVTSKATVVRPALKTLSRELKRIGWAERSLTGRLGLAGAAIGLAVFGGQGAGIAAMGTAIGVPLWVVLGSGAAFAGVMIEEFGPKRH
jgi:hypothetical protein